LHVAIYAFISAAAGQIAPGNQSSACLEAYIKHHKPESWRVLRLAVHQAAAQEHGPLSAWPARVSPSREAPPMTSGLLLPAPPIRVRVGRRNAGTRSTVEARGLVLIEAEV